MQTYNAKNEMYVKVIKDSITEENKRVVTFHAHYPRIIHSEIMTHRVFSRNARSSRAVPVKTIIQEVIDKPFIPWHWGKNQKGMQAKEENNSLVSIAKAYIHKTRNGWEEYEDIYHQNEMVSREKAWLQGRDYAVEIAQGFAAADYHKQLVNRLLEPFSWIDTLITTTDLANFYHLRDHEDAEPHFHDLAKLVKFAINDSKPKLLKPGEWHLPFINGDDVKNAFAYAISNNAYPSEQDIINILIKLSVARSARISYKPFDGNGDIEAEINRYDLLVGSEPLHASPAEHQVQIDWLSAKGAGDAAGGWSTVPKGYENEHLSGNLGPGFIQYRKTLKGECFHGTW